ncbi:MAG: hypothetical protein HZA20_09545 [Nitrospirae bacterium]|nr:hypothetical protein [Nitrospirota bacterium]
MHSNKSLSRFLVIAVSAAFVGLAGCASMDDVTGKKRITELEQSVAQMEKLLADQKVDCANKESQLRRQSEEQLASQKADCERSVTTQKADCDKGMSDIKGQMADQKARCDSREAEMSKILETEKMRGKGIKVVFFSGDIIYDISSEAFTDYKAGLRYRALRDTAFAEKLKLFEDGKGGDGEVLAALKAVDRSQDKLISAQEASAFRAAEESAYMGGGQHQEHKDQPKQEVK